MIPRPCCYIWDTCVWGWIKDAEHGRETFACNCLKIPLHTKTSPLGYHGDGDVHWTTLIVRSITVEQLSSVHFWHKFLQKFVHVHIMSGIFLVGVWYTYDWNTRCLGLLLYIFVISWRVSLSAWLHITDTNRRLAMGWSFRRGNQTYNFVLVYFSTIICAYFRNSRGERGGGIWSQPQGFHPKAS